MPIPVGQHLDLQGTARVTSMANAVNDQDAVTFAQLKAAIEGVKAKDDVVAASVANVNLSSPGTALDGVTLTLNDRILLKNQTTASQNGIYIWTASGTALTRALDGSTWDELESALVGVKGGTVNGATYWRQTAINGTLDTTGLVFVPFGVVSPAASETTAGIMELATQAEVDAGTDDLRAVTPLKMATWSGRSRRMSALVGDGSATSYTVTHNFNTREVDVTVFRNSGNYEELLVEVQHTTVNSVTLVFAAAPASNAFMAVVGKA